MASVNDCQFIGYLSADPEIRATPGGVKVANFRIGCTDTWNDQGGQKQESTEWVNIVAWRQQADHVQRFLRKGTRVYVRGALKTRTYEDKNGGGKRYVAEVHITKFLALSGHAGEPNSDYRDSGRTADRERGADYYDPPPQGPSNGSDDDLPF